MASKKRKVTKARKRASPAKRKPAKRASKVAKPKAPGTKTPKKVAPSSIPFPRAPGQKLYWLVKTEPDVFSFTDLMNAPSRTTHWDGIRNYTARNYLRDQMKAGDGVLVYHSNAEPPAIAGLAEVAREAYPDHTQFDAKHHHFDPAAKADNPAWYMVDIKGVAPLARSLPLPELKSVKSLTGMMLLQKGSRLSVQPVTAAEWAIVLDLGGVKS